MAVRQFTAVAVLAALSGCSTMQLETSWQGEHAVDVAQTLSIVSDPCYHEADPVTRNIIGAHPSQAGVLEWGVGLAGGHYLVARWLDDHAPAWASKVWEWSTLLDVSVASVHNYSIGIRVGGQNTVTNCAASAPVETRLTRVMR